MPDVFRIFTNQKSFDGAVGNPLANRAGLHVFRILLSDVAQWLKCLPFFLLAPRAAWTFHRQGYLVIENFLPNRQFQAVALEVYRKLHELPPPPGNLKRQRFGDKLPNSLGYDRYDGATLNRFVRINYRGSVVRHALQSFRMHRLSLALFGMINNPLRYFIYELRHGDEADLPDSQKEIHKDTFHHTYKLWYFTDTVTRENGPFEYSPGSHRMSAARLRWEYRRSIDISSGKTSARGGAFRATPAELEAMGCAPLQPVLVSANSLVIADTRGFHRRGFAEKDVERLGVYGYFRPNAFWPFIEP